MIRDKSKKEQAKLPKGVIAVAPPSFRRERALIKRGVWPVAGCDEAGRGPLAGPVVAAAVVLDPTRIPKGIDDSRKSARPRPLRWPLDRRRGSIATTSCVPRYGR
jgi:ribonuclease HII